MKILVLYAHPIEESFNAALHRLIVERLTAAGHAVDDLDLYAEDFDPRLSRAERLAYHDGRGPQDPADPYVRRLLAAQVPRWADLPIAVVQSAGTDNALYRLGDDMVVL